MDFRVISIGALDAHPLWNERTPVRTGHATTTLVRSGKDVILVDPGLPGPIVGARLAERSGLQARDVTHVFLTSFRPDVRRGLEQFPAASWLISETERETVGVGLVEAARRAERSLEEEDRHLAAQLWKDVALLEKCEAAPDKLARDVDLYPMPGVTPGMCGLLLADPRYTVIICGDAIPTVEHLEQGRVPQWAADVEKARESFMEAVETADVLVLGRDNLVMNPTRRVF